MAGSNRGRTGPAWNALRSYVIRTHTNCAWCGELVDKTLSGRHRMGPTVDHIIALEDGGSLLDPLNATLMHNTCNVRKENERRRARKVERTQRFVTSRQW